MLLNSVPPRARWHQRPELGLDHRHVQHCSLRTAHEDQSRCSVVLGRARQANYALRVVPGLGRENYRVMDLHRSRCRGEIGYQRLVVGKREVTSDYVLRGFSA